MIQNKEEIQCHPSETLIDCSHSSRVPLVIKKNILQGHRLKRNINYCTGNVSFSQLHYLIPSVTLSHSLIPVGSLEE